MLRCMLINSDEIKSFWKTGCYSLNHSCLSKWISPASEPASIISIHNNE